MFMSPPQDSYATHLGKSTSVGDDHDDDDDEDGDDADYDDGDDTTQTRNYVRPHVNIGAIVEVQNQ